jgi:hypothetical protein
MPRRRCCGLSLASWFKKQAGAEMWQACPILQGAYALRIGETS